MLSADPGILEKLGGEDGARDGGDVLRKSLQRKLQIKKNINK